jgi:hypothetical protein
MEPTVGLDALEEKIIFPLPRIEPRPYSPYSRAELFLYIIIRSEWW